MRIKNKDLNINELAQKWDASGCVTVYHDGESIYRDFFGYADRETKEPISEEFTYLLSGCSHSLLSYSLLLLEDMKMLKIRDTVISIYQSMNIQAKYQLNILCKANQV